MDCNYYTCRIENICCGPNTASKLLQRVVSDKWIQPTVNHLISCILYKFHKNVEFKPIALRKAKIVCNFGLSECSRVQNYWQNFELATK